VIGYPFVGAAGAKSQKATWNGVRGRMKGKGMESTNHPLSGRDLWINTPIYRNWKDIKIEASIAIAIEIAEEDYQTAEDIAMPHPVT
jgi:hypothetical protein